VGRLIAGQISVLVCKDTAISPVHFRLGEESRRWLCGSKIVWPT
jgi:hypothetical protein